MKPAGVSRMSWAECGASLRHGGGVRHDVLGQMSLLNGGKARRVDVGKGVVGLERSDVELADRRDEHVGVVADAGRITFVRFDEFTF